MTNAHFRRKLSNDYSSVVLDTLIDMQLNFNACYSRWPPENVSIIIVYQPLNLSIRS